MRRRKPLREKRKKRKLKNKLIYGIVAFVLIFVCFLTYSSLNPTNQTNTPKAALIDHLSFIPSTQNESFKTACMAILGKAGFNVAYYKGEDVTVDFYRNLTQHDHSLIVLRVHSAAITNTTWVGFFTSEIANSTSEAKYHSEIRDNQLAKAFLPTMEEVTFFGITPRFVRFGMKGIFKGTVIIMMGCEGLNHTSMAEEFRQKGAKVYISWTGPVTINHTDDATIRLLQSLLQQNQTIKTAVDLINPDPAYKSQLDYYPGEVGDNNIQDFISGLTLRIIDMSIICYKVCLFSSSNRFEAMK